MTNIFCCLLPEQIELLFAGNNRASSRLDALKSRCIWRKPFKHFRGADARLLHFRVIDDIERYMYLEADRILCFAFNFMVGGSLRACRHLSAKHQHVIENWIKIGNHNVDVPRGAQKEHLAQCSTIAFKRIQKSSSYDFALMV